MAGDDHHDEAKITSSAHIVAPNDDVLTDIFLRLPLKSLIRFRFVSKHWDFIVSNLGHYHMRNHEPLTAVGLLVCPNIIHPHVLMTHKYAHVVSFDKSSTSRPLREIKFNKDPMRWDTKILNSCNGLLLCGPDDVDNPSWNYYIYNPTTNKYSTLPKIDGGRGRSNMISIRGMILAFDPPKSPHYKIVCVRSIGVCDLCEFQVYSSKTRCWRKHGEPFRALVVFKDGVYWNGAIHWITFNNETGKSIYFNPDNHDQILPKVMPTPLIFPDCVGDHYFGESCGHLHYIDVYKRVMCDKRIHYILQHEFSVYEMKSDYSEWFVKYKVDVSDVVIDRHTSICTLVRGTKDEDSFLVLGIEKRIVRCNLVRGTFETIFDFDGVGNRHICPDFKVTLQYIESLGSV